MNVAIGSTGLMVTCDLKTMRHSLAFLSLDRVLAIA